MPETPWQDDPVALGKWNELASTYPVDDPLIADLVAAYCTAHARWYRATAWLTDANHGDVVTIRDDKGNIRMHGIAPQVRLAEQASREMERLATRLRRLTRR